MKGTAVDVNLTQIMVREGIVEIKAWPGGRFSVKLRDGRFAVGATVGEALALAKLPGAENLQKVAA